MILQIVKKLRIIRQKKYDRKSAIFCYLLRCNYEVMGKYICNPHYLKTLMMLLKDKSPSIQFEVLYSVHRVADPDPGLFFGSGAIWTRFQFYLRVDGSVLDFSEA